MTTIANPKTLAEVQAYAVGTWNSLSVELRPSADNTGQVTPFLLTRRFTYLNAEQFVGIVTRYADNYGQMPLMELEFKGHLRWGNAHPIAEGAWELDYIVDEGFSITPLNENIAAMLNQIPVEGLAPFAVGQKQDVLKKAFPVFNQAEGQITTDHDLLYFSNGMLFMGAKHVDGASFDTPERRPHQLQIPLARQS